MHKIAMISPKGQATMTVYYDSKAKCNPYRIYLEWGDISEHGIVSHKKLFKKFADLYSCGCELMEYSLKHNEEGR